MNKKKKRTTERYDKSRIKNVKFDASDIVAVKVAKYATGEFTKLQTPCKGPCVITEVWPNDTYKIQYLAAKGESKRPTTAHVSQLKIWQGRPNDSDNDDES